MASQGLTSDPQVKHMAVKESVFPFARFTNTDVILGPEMKSTCEVMGLDSRVEVAFGKSQLACGSKPPQGAWRSSRCVTMTSRRWSTWPVAWERSGAAGYDRFPLPSARGLE